MLPSINIALENFAQGRNMMLNMKKILVAVLSILILTPFLPAQNRGGKYSPRVMLGIDVLESMNFAPLKGKRVGLLTHPAGVNRYGVSTVDVLRRSKNVRLVALFGPEHGIYGDEKADVPVLDKIDRRTGLPVYSLYGKYRKPTPEMLRKIDVLVVDLQGLGVRSYTFKSCMLRAMEACFENGKEIVVLDRPNPLGGLKVDGPPLDAKFKSYVGMFQVPYVHGMTIGELARMAKDTYGAMEITSKQQRNGKLTVIPMRGWTRSMLWPDTGLRWVPTSPAVPSFAAAVGYSMTARIRHDLSLPYADVPLKNPRTNRGGIAAIQYSRRFVQTGCGKGLQRQKGGRAICHCRLEHRAPHRNQLLFDEGGMPI